MSKEKGEGGMGFRDLEAFNVALLAKTAWRLIQDPNAHWARILKGLYFADGNFLQAKKGNRASWGWTSILEGRDLLISDLCWRIGNGVDVRVFEDSWLPEAEGQKLRSRSLNEEMKRLKVCELIVNGDWCFDGTDVILDEEDKALIKQVRIPVLEARDKIIWQKSRDGEYIVKLGYKVALSKPDMKLESRPGGSYTPSRKLWSGIWKIKMPPKVLHFIWRAVSGSLATREALFKRKCSSSPMCDICKTDVESIEHMLFLCPWTRQCWFGSPLSFKFEGIRNFRMDRWLEEWFCDNEKLVDQHVALFAGICWGIWKARCKHIFEHVNVDAYLCIAGAMRLFRDYWGVLEKKKMVKPTDECCERNLIWQKPEWGVIKVNVDAAFCSVNKKAAIGMVGQDWEGRFLGGAGKVVKAGSVFMAECMAALEAIECKDLWGENVVLETDCQELFLRLKNKEVRGCEWGCVDILEKCVLLLHSLEYRDWKVSLVARTGNNAADWIAAEAMRGLVPQGWLSRPPPSLNSLMMKDMEVLQNQEADKTGIG